MKTYIFLLIGDARGSYPEPLLYAFTAKKSLAKSFKETRDMDNFIYKEVNIDEEEYNRFASKYPKKNLIMSSLSTRNDNGDITKISLPLTYSEEEFILLRSDNVMYELSKYTIMESMILDDHILDALNDISYFDIMAFYNNMDRESFSSLTMKLNSLDLTYDQLEIFLYFYGYMMKKG
jgi:hypothetical protein